jgi:pseudouridine-5'-phosphate glycosidase
VHRSPALDISADLLELSRTSVCVVCAGAKNILDIPMTLEVLETHGVPVVGYRTDEFPGFYVRTSGVRIDARVDSAEEAARLLETHWELGGAGVVLAQPPPVDVALNDDEFDAALQLAERDAHDQGIRGKELTPFLLKRIAELTNGKTLIANRALVVENARLAARVVLALSNQ